MCKKKENQTKKQNKKKERERKRKTHRQKRTAVAKTKLMYVLKGKNFIDKLSIYICFQHQKMLAFKSSMLFCRLM